MIKLVNSFRFGECKPSIYCLSLIDAVSLAIFGGNCCLLTVSVDISVVLSGSEIGDEQTLMDICLDEWISFRVKNEDSNQLLALRQMWQVY